MNNGVHNGSNENHGVGRGRRPRLPRRIVQRRPFNAGEWPEPPRASHNIQHIAERLHEWVRELGIAEEEQDCVEGLLVREYLLSLPLPPNTVLDTFEGTVRASALRYIFRCNLARILGWTERRETGSIGGFPDWLNDELRNAIYPGV